MLLNTNRFDGDAIHSLVLGSDLFDEIADAVRDGPQREHAKVNFQNESIGAHSKLPERPLHLPPFVPRRQRHRQVGQSAVVLDRDTGSASFTC